MKEQEFNESTWKYMDVVLVSEERYPMTLWLRNNYNFCGKSYDEIIEKFGIDENIKVSNLKLVYIIKQHNNNFILGIDPPSDLAYLIIYFKNKKVLKATIEERETKDDPWRETVIGCEK